MAKKFNKITINAFEKVMKETYEPVSEFEWHGIDVVVLKTLPVKEMLSFVDSVAKTCFRDDTGEYEPGAKDFAIRSLVLEKYANFTMPASINLQYELVYQTDAFREVLDRINPDQFRMIIDAIDEKIDYMKQANILAFKQQVNSFTSALENFEKQMDEFSPEDIRSLMGTLSNAKIDEEKLVQAYNKNKVKG